MVAKRGGLLASQVVLLRIACASAKASATRGRLMKVKSPKLRVAAKRKKDQLLKLKNISYIIAYTFYDC
jgi:hypothetical protein